MTRMTYSGTFTYSASRSARDMPSSWIGESVICHVKRHMHIPRQPECARRALILQERCMYI